jgi:hypothetical protein
MLQEKRAFSLALQRGKKHGRLRGDRHVSAYLAAIAVPGATSAGALGALKRITRKDNGMKDNSGAVQHKVGTREEWLAARLDLLKAEKEHARRGDELA